MTSAPNRRRPLRRFSLDPQTIGILDRVGNASAYVDRVVIERHREWVEALDYLEREGWHAAELHAAFDLLNGSLLAADQPHVWLSASLEDGGSAELLDRWGVSRRVWSARWRQVGQSETLARALWYVVREFWAGNEELGTRIKRASE